MGLRSWVKRLERGARGDLESFVLEDGGRYYYNPTSGERFLVAESPSATLQALYSSSVHVPQSLDWKPASVGAMVTIVGVSALPLAIMASKSPVNAFSLS